MNYQSPHGKLSPKDIRCYLIKHKKLCNSQYWINENQQLLIKVFYAPNGEVDTEYGFSVKSCKWLIQNHQKITVYSHLKDAEWTPITKEESRSITARFRMARELLQ